MQQLHGSFPRPPWQREDLRQARDVASRGEAPGRKRTAGRQHVLHRGVTPGWPQALDVVHLDQLSRREAVRRSA